MPAATIKITRGTTENLSYPRLSAAWKPSSPADYAQAETLYREVLATRRGQRGCPPRRRAVAARGGRMDEARSGYDAVLRADPRNAAAVCGLEHAAARTGGRQHGEHPEDHAAGPAQRRQPALRTRAQVRGPGRWPDAQVRVLRCRPQRPCERRLRLQPGGEPRPAGTAGTGRNLLRAGLAARDGQRPVRHGRCAEHAWPRLRAPAP